MLSKSKIAFLTTAALIIAALIIGMLPSSRANTGGADQTALSADSGATPEESPVAGLITYQSYLDKNRSEVQPASSVEVAGRDYSGSQAAEISIGNYAGRDEALLWNNGEGRVEWKINVPESGMYLMNLTYCGIPAKGNDIELGVQIDGAYPFNEAKDISLTRIWKDAGDIKSDTKGNQLRPEQAEVFEWQTRSLADTYGQYNYPYLFYFTKGEHTLAITLLCEAIAIDKIALVPETHSLPYSQVLAANGAQGITDSKGYMQVYQAEKMYQKSSTMLIQTDDRSDIAVEPSHPYLIRLNTIGKYTWKLTGQWISWKISVPEDGYYEFSFKVRQNITRGMNSSRRLYVDGKVPFAEMNAVEFPYATSWYMKTLNDDQGKPYRFYLTAGEHELKLEAVTGKMAEPLREIESIVFDLNRWYRKIIMITGSNPDTERDSVIDTNRDFLLDQKIPGLMDGFKDIAARLRKQLDYINGISQGEGNAASIINEMIVQLEKFSQKPETIPVRLDSYRGNVSSLASWLLEMRDQPLEMDYFIVSSPGEKQPSANAGFFSQIGFRMNMFFNSFTQDYSSVGTVDKGKSLNVWVCTSELTGAANTGFFSGRDQAQVIKSMIDDMFTSEYKVGVNLSLVSSSSTLIQATLAGKGPDVALFVSRDTPVNLAMRGALLDLSKLSGYREAADRFYNSAIIPYQYNGGVYALPETQSFDMMFCRTDVLSELGLKIPETWDDFYALLPTLQQNNMQIGIYENQTTFESLLYQHNGTFYNEKLTATAFDKPEALEAFKQWTGLYARYSLPLVFDFFNRFRNGEMPLAIVSYTNCNYIAAAAPELRNLWTMVPVPGIKQKDGSVNRAETCNGTSCIILSDTKMPEESFEFIKWWTGSEAQTRFGTELEQLMGPAARYPTANIQAFKNLPWTKDQAKNLEAQWKSVTSIPQVPGNYYISRNITFAFRAVVYDYANERETLYKYNKEINKEIRRKRIEFGLPVE